METRDRQKYSDNLIRYSVSWRTHSPNFSVPVLKPSSAHSFLASFRLGPVLGVGNSRLTGVAFAELEIGGFPENIFSDFVQVNPRWNRDHVRKRD